MTDEERFKDNENGTISDTRYNLMWTKEDSYQMRNNCLLYTSPSPRDQRGSRMPSSA